MKRENIQSYFNDVAHDPVKKRFWETVNPFLSENGSHGQEDFLLEENGELVKDQKQIADIFCDYYTNIVKHATGNPPVQIPFRQNSDVIEDILSHYENHESIINIRNSMHNKTFEMPLATEPKIREVITNIDPSKATGIDNVKLVVGILCVFMLNMGMWLCASPWLATSVRFPGGGTRLRLLTIAD